MLEKRATHAHTANESRVRKRPVFPSHPAVMDSTVNCSTVKRGRCHTRFVHHPICCRNSRSHLPGMKENDKVTSEGLCGLGDPGLEQWPLCLWGQPARLGRPGASQPPGAAQDHQSLTRGQRSQPPRSWCSSERAHQLTAELGL